MVFKGFPFGLGCVTKGSFIGSPVGQCMTTRTRMGAVRMADGNHVR